MKYRMDSACSEATYMQLYKALREDIVEGHFVYGARLPSKRILAEETGVSRITVAHAYALLCEEGYVVAKERSGYFVSFREDGGFSQTTAFSSASFVSKEKGEKSQFPFSVLAKAMRRVLSEYGESLFIKSPGKGDLEFRLELCRYLARSRGIEAEPEQIVIGAGSEYLYNMIVCLLGTEKCYALEEPSYEKIRKVYSSSGARCEHLALGRDGIESSALSESRADVLHVTPYRSFPSGVTASASKKREYLRWAEKEERYLVEDDFESEFTLSRKPADTLFSMTKEENVIYINSFSKTVSPSLRVSYMVLPKSLVPLFDQKLGFTSCTVSLLDQMLLKEIISKGDFERHINRVRRELRRKKEGE